jgi:hypothetical protein
MLPFTPAQFLTVFTEYNLAIWPSQIVAYLLGGMAVLLLFWQTAGPRRLIAVVLSAMWIWTGVLYHGVWFSQVNKSAYLFATLFVIEGGRSFLGERIRKSTALWLPPRCRSLLRSGIRRLCCNCLSIDWYGHGS